MGVNHAVRFTGNLTSSCNRIRTPSRRPIATLNALDAGILGCIHIPRVRLVIVQTVIERTRGHAIANDIRSKTVDKASKTSILLLGQATKAK